MTSVLPALLACLLLRGGTEARAAGCGSERYARRPLAEALESLRSCGLRLIYSSDLVRPDLLVETEPAGATPRLILDEILSLHGLAAVDGPGGSLLVVGEGEGLPPSGGIEGRVISRPIGLPVPQARVRVVGQEAETLTSRKGTFRFPEVPRGSYVLEVSLDGRLLGRFDGIRVKANKTTRPLLELSRSPGLVEELTVTPSLYEMARDAPEPRQHVPGENLERAATLGGDVHRAVSHLPGLASGDRSAQINARGGAADEVLFVLDGLEILDPFHLRALQSFSGIVDTRAIAGADVLTGSFPAQYGDRMSGVIDLTSRSPSGDGQTAIGTNFINSHFLSNGRFGLGSGQWMLSARAWYPDALYEVVAPTGEDIGPQYADFLGKAQFQLGESTTLRANVLSSQDLADFEEDEGGVEQEIAVRSGSRYAWVSLDNTWTPRLLSRTLFSVSRIHGEREGSTADTGASAILVRDQRAFDAYAFRQDWSYRASDSVLLKLGLETRRMHGDYDYAAEIPSGAGTSERTIVLEPSGDELGAYLSGRFRIFRPLTAELGVRWDRQTHTVDSQASPRINILYTMGERAALRAGWGRFYQSQGIHELQVEDGSTDFFPAQLSEHRVVDFEYLFRGGLRLRLNAYSKEMSNLHPRYENLFDPLELFPEAELDRVRIAAQRAEAKGLELFLESPAGRRLAWWASYAAASVEDRIDGRMVPRSWDQRHAANLGLHYRANSRWTFNVAGVYHSGWPTTGVRAGTAVSADGSPTVQAVAGPRNGERFPAYHRLDLRVSRHVELDRSRLTFFLDVFNLYDQQNPCCVDEIRISPRADGSGRVIRDNDYWLGRVPTLGVVWELRP